MIGILVTVLSVIAAAVLTWPSFFRIEQVFPLAQVVSFRALLVAGFIAITVVMLLLAFIRPMRTFVLSIALVTALAAVANGFILGARGFGSDDLPAPTDTSVRVMTWNTAGAATDPATIAQMAVAMKADIVALPETTIETGEQVAVQMRDLGQRMWAHHVEFEEPEGDSWDAQSTSLLISPELGDYSVIESSANGSSNTSQLPSAVVMPLDGDGPIVVAVHAVAPRPGYMEKWQEDLRWLADQCAENNVIMAGDFNATLDHMARWGVDGAALGTCYDGASASGNGAVGTWPTSLPRLAGVPIDHVMATEHWVATGSSVLPVGSSRSDHRPLIVQFEPAG